MLTTEIFGVITFEALFYVNQNHHPEKTRPQTMENVFKFPAVKLRIVIRILIVKVA